MSNSYADWCIEQIREKHPMYDVMVVYCACDGGYVMATTGKNIWTSEAIQAVGPTKEDALHSLLEKLREAH